MTLIISGSWLDRCHARHSIYTSRSMPFRIHKILWGVPMLCEPRLDWPHYLFLLASTETWWWVSSHHEACRRYWDNDHYTSTTIYHLQVSLVQYIVFIKDHEASSITVALDLAISCNARWHPPSSSRVFLASVPTASSTSFCPSLERFCNLEVLTAAPQMCSRKNHGGNGGLMEHVIRIWTFHTFEHSKICREWRSTRQPYETCSRCHTS